MGEPSSLRAALARRVPVCEKMISPMLLRSRMLSETRAMTPGISLSSAVRMRSRGSSILKRMAQRSAAPAMPLMTARRRMRIAEKMLKWWRR